MEEITKLTTRHAKRFKKKRKKKIRDAIFSYAIIFRVVNPGKKFNYLGSVVTDYRNPYPNPGLSHTFLTNHPLTDHVLRGISVATTLGQLRVGESM